MLLAVAAFLRFDEPRLHRAAEPVALRQQVATTIRAMTRQRAVLLAVLLAALASVVSQTVFEFGPLWLVALHAAPGIYGPYWAALVSTLGLGGYLVSRLRLGTPPPWCRSLSSGQSRRSAWCSAGHSCW